MVRTREEIENEIEEIKEELEQAWENRRFGYAYDLEDCLNELEMELDGYPGST